MMRMPRFRFTVRRMMVAVAIVAMLLGAWAALARRTANLRQVALEHGQKAGRLEIETVTSAISQGEAARRMEIVHWHDAMSAKYERAARYPWLTVAPDPPEPK